jgi:1,4-dihydroxy-6-naphthoate synthase
VKTLTLGYSPCPNDTFIFYGLVHGRIDTGDLAFKETLMDVEALNQKAFDLELDITKVSYHAYLYLRKNYTLLRAGGALGRGCGPLIVAKEDYDIKELRGRRIAIPGRYTTAYLLLKLFDPELCTNPFIMTFDRIMPAVKNGEVDAGLIIHEGRFTFPFYGLKEIIDLGKWWEDETGLPIPLGCIIARRTLGEEIIKRINEYIRMSLEYSLANPARPMNYIKQHSQELSDHVIKQHINLYVNNYSLDIGDEGEKAIEELLKRSADRGILSD